MRFSELIEMDLKDGRTDAIRKAFAPYSVPLDVTEYERQAIIVLVNLSHKRTEVEDLLDEHLAARTLRDKKHLDQCLKEVGWFHTHNLKCPDGRVSGQRVIADVRHRLSGFIGSSSYPKRVGWAHNSRVINKAKLFCTEFRWQGKSMNLAELLTSECEAWEKSFQKIGVTSKVLRAWKEQLTTLMPNMQMPESVSPFSPQARFPYRGGYLSITPVVSHAVLCDIQQLCRAKIGHFQTINHARSAIIGNLSASLGGKVAVMNYPPPVWFSRFHTLNQSRHKRLEAGFDLFDVGAIYSQDFLKSLSRLVDVERLPTLKERRSSKVASMRVIRRKIADWLAPVIELKETPEFEANSRVASDEELEWKLVAAELAHWPRFHRELNQKIHLHLQSGREASRFAYHPALLSPLSGQLKAVLGSFSNSGDCDSVSSDGSTFLYLQSLRVFDAQAVANPYLVGIPSLTALWGMVHNYQRKVQKISGEGVQFTGVSWFIRSYSLSDGTRLPEPSVMRSCRQNVSRPGIIDTPCCDLVMDLVIRVSTSHQVSIDDYVETLLKATLPSAFAGGVLHPPSLYENREWLSAYTSPDMLFNKLACLPRNGCWILPGAPVKGSLDSMLKAAQSMPYMKPAMLGYGFLEDPRAREGSVEPYHVFAEPLIGNVLCASPIEVRFKGPEHFFGNGFWSMECQDHAMLMKKA